MQVRNPFLPFVSVMRLRMTYNNSTERCWGQVIPDNVKVIASRISDLYVLRGYNMTYYATM